MKYIEKRMVFVIESGVFRIRQKRKVGVRNKTVKLVMFACSKYCVFFIFSFMRVLINATPPDVKYLKQKGQIYACFNYCVLMHSH